MEKQTMKDMMKTHYGSEKLDKEKELNAEMTIKEQAKDEYTQKIETLGGNK